jgi:hypothetical protein
METLPISENKPTLESVTKQFEVWRANRQKRDRIPQHLWQAATQLCKDHPPTLVCRWLRLSFADLKKHLAAEKDNPRVQFMKIDLSGPIGNWQLCCQRSDGSQLSFTANAALPDIDQLLEKFLS